MRPKPCPNLQKIPRVQRHTFNLCITHRRLILGFINKLKTVYSGFIQMMRVILMQRRNKRKLWVSGTALLMKEHTHSGHWGLLLVSIQITALDTWTVSEAIAVMHWVAAIDRSGSGGVLGNIYREWLCDCNRILGLYLIANTVCISFVLSPYLSSSGALFAFRASFRYSF